MKYTIPKRIEQMTPYQPITGEYKIRMDANESYINLSKEQIDLVEKKLNQLEYNRYPDPYAKDLCKAFAEYYGIDKNLVTAGNGSDEIISLIFSTFFEKSDIVGVFSNDFSMYKVYCETYGVNYKIIPKEKDLTIDVEKTIKFIEDENITALIFSNPCNPTSIGLQKEKVKYLLENTQALVILDEAYMDFWNESLLDEVEKYDNLIILKTCSKAIGLASIRLGFFISNENFTKVIRAIKSPYNVNSVTQAYGEVLLSYKEQLDNATKEIILNKNDLQEKMFLLKDKFSNLILEVYKSDTNFVFIRTDYAKEIFESLLSRSIAIRYMGDYLRISTSNKVENQKLYDEMIDILTSISERGK